MTESMSVPQTLADWLAHCERLHPVTIDMGLERVREVATRMGLTAIPPVKTEPHNETP